MLLPVGLEPESESSESGALSLSSAARHIDIHLLSLIYVAFHSAFIAYEYVLLYQQCFLQMIMFLCKQTLFSLGLHFSDCNKLWTSKRTLGMYVFQFCKEKLHYLCYYTLEFWTIYSYFQKHKSSTIIHLNKDTVFHKKFHTSVPFHG